MYRIINQSEIDAAKRAGKIGVNVPLPKYQSRRGSNKVESRHRLINSLNVGRSNMGPDVAGPMLSEYDFQSNLRAGIKYNGETDTGIVRHERLQHLHLLCLKNGWADVTQNMGYRPMDPNYTTEERFYFDVMAAPGVSIHGLLAAAGTASLSVASAFLPSSRASTRGGRAAAGGHGGADSDDDDGDGGGAEEGDEADFLLREFYAPIGEDEGIGDAGDASMSPAPQHTPGAGPSSAPSVPTGGLGPASASPAAGGPNTGVIPASSFDPALRIPMQTSSMPPLPLAAPPSNIAAAAAARARVTSRAPGAPFDGATPASVGALGVHGHLSGSVRNLSSSRPPVLASGVLPTRSSPAQLVAAAAKAPHASGTGAWHPSRHLLWSQQCRPVQTTAEKTLFLELVPRFRGDWMGMAEAWNKIALERLASDDSLRPDVASQIYLKATNHLKEYHDAIMNQEALRMALTPQPHKPAAGAEPTAGGGPCAAAAAASLSSGAGAAGRSSSAAATGLSGGAGAAGQPASPLLAGNLSGGGAAAVGFFGNAAAFARSERKRKMQRPPSAASAFASTSASLQRPQIDPAEAGGGPPSALPTSSKRRGGVAKKKYCALCNWPVSGANAAGFYHGKPPVKGAAGASVDPPFCKLLMASQLTVRLPCAKCLGTACTLHEGLGVCCSRLPGEMEGMDFTFERIKEWSGWVPE